MMDHNRTRHLLEAYALGALEEDERQAVERHLARCADCRQSARELDATADLLPRALAAASPLRLPHDLKARLLQHVEATPQTPLPAPVTVAGSRPQSPNVTLHDDGASRGRPASGVAGQWRTVAAVAAIVALVISLAWGVRLSEALDQERAMRQSIAAHFSQQQEIVLEVVDAEDATRLILRSPDPDSRAYGKLFTRPDMPHVVAMAARLPAPAPGQTFHLWLTRDSHTFLAGILPVNDQGFGLLTFDADVNGPAYEAATLTLQPAGAEAPGGETVLTWSP